MSNYPPGVSGNEYEIAGPSWTGTVEAECEECGDAGLMDAEGHGWERWAYCENGHVIQLPDEEYDPPEYEPGDW